MQPRGDQLVQALEARLLGRDFQNTPRVQAECDEPCDQRKVQELVRVCEWDVEKNVGGPLGDSQLLLARARPLARAESSHAR